MSRLTASALKELDDQDSSEDDAAVARSDSDVSVAFDSEEERLDRLMTPRAADEPISPVFLNRAHLPHLPVNAPVKMRRHSSSDSIASSVRAGGDGWYFAYGSNMNVAQLITRIGDFKSKQLMYLPNYKLTFNKKLSLKPSHRISNADKCGFANIEPSVGEKVYGIAYLIAESQLQAMDVFEGVGTGHYSRQLMVCYDAKDQPISCHVYIACPNAIGQNLLPTEGYLSHLLGGRGLLPAHYTAWLMQHPTIKRQF